MHVEERVFCASFPGGEDLLCRELGALGLSARAVKGGVEADGEDAAAKACIGSRIAETVLVRLWEGLSQDLGRGRREAQRQLPGVPLIVRPGSPSSVSADAAGLPLYRRGWRAFVGAAPLRETVAAALLLFGGFDGERPFLDPMCGSGTLAVEAALLAGRRAPGLSREFAFETWPGADRTRIAALRQRLMAACRPISVRIEASDKNAGVLRLAQKNAEAAGMREAVHFSRADAAVRSLPPPAGGVRGLCAVNPPWGARLGEGVAGSWHALSALMERLAGWDLALLAAGRGRATPLGLDPKDALDVRIGGLAARFLKFTL